MQQNLPIVALEVLYDSLIQWLRIGCCVGWEEDYLDVVPLEFRNVATEVIKTEEHSASLMREFADLHTQLLWKKFAIIRTFEFALYSTEMCLLLFFG